MSSAAQGQDVDLICHICKRPLTEDGEVWCSAVHNLTLAGAACVHHYVMVSGGMRCKKCGHVMGQPERPGDAAAYTLVSRPVDWMPENVIATYDTREEANAALAWYERTYGSARGSLFVREPSANTTSPVEVLRNFIYDDSRSVPAGAAEIEAQAEAEAALDAFLWEAKATRAALAQVLGWGDFRACSAAQTEEFAAWAKQVGLAHLGQPHIREDLFA